MDSIATESSNSVHTRRVARDSKPVRNSQTVEKTPESELMTVEEYFDEVWQRHLEKHEKLQD
ncbi:MAG: hypothetical protein KBT45_02385 [Bacteroidales bacterium]|nr:hypothetical protein [Candidatus Colimorpha pelethequi]